MRRGDRNYKRETDGRERAVSAQSPLSIRIAKASQWLEFLLGNVLEGSPSDDATVDLVCAVDDAELSDRFVEVRQRKVLPDPVCTTTLDSQIDCVLGGVCGEHFAHRDGDTGLVAGRDPVGGVADSGSGHVEFGLGVGDSVAKRLLVRERGIEPFAFARVGLRDVEGALGHAGKRIQWVSRAGPRRSWA